DRWDQVAVLTGNDDAIVHDLLTPYRARVGGRLREVRARGGLLGQWAVGTKAAVERVARANAAVTADAIDQDLLALADDLVQVNARSEERRVGKECRTGGAPNNTTK